MDQVLAHSFGFPNNKVNNLEYHNYVNNPFSTRHHEPTESDSPLNSMYLDSF